MTQMARIHEIADVLILRRAHPIGEYDHCAKLLAIRAHPRNPRSHFQV